ncbi:MAG: hypothetical protein ABI641_12170 [Caldimonas sp.]
MSTLYFLAFCGVCIAVLGILVDAVLRVSQTPRWVRHRPLLSIVATVDTRTQDLPFVGADRRSAVTTSTDARALEGLEERRRA